MVLFRHKLKFKLESIKPISNKENVFSHEASLNVVPGEESSLSVVPSEDRNVRDCHVILSPINTKLIKVCHVKVQKLKHNVVPVARNTESQANLEPRRSTRERKPRKILDL